MSYLSSFFGGGSSGSSGYVSQPAVAPYRTPSSVSMPLTSSSLGIGNSFSPSRPSFSNLSVAGTVAAFDSASSLMSPGLSIGVLAGADLSVVSWDAISRESSSYAPPAEKPSFFAGVSDGASSFFGGLSDILAPPTYGDTIVPPVAPVESALPAPAGVPSSKNPLIGYGMEKFSSQAMKASNPVGRGKGSPEEPLTTRTDSGIFDVSGGELVTRPSGPASVFTSSPTATSTESTLSAPLHERMIEEAGLKRSADLAALTADPDITREERAWRTSSINNEYTTSVQRAESIRDREEAKSEKNLMADISVKQGEAAANSVLSSAANKHNLSDYALKKDNVALGAARLNKLAADVAAKKAAADQYPPGPARAAAYTAVTAAVNEYNMYRDTVGSMKIRGGILGLQTGTADQGLTEVDWLGAAGAISIVSPFVMFGLEQMAAKDREDRLMKFQMDMRNQDREHDIEMLNIRGQQQLALQGAVNEGSGGGSTASSANINLGGAFSG